MNAFFYHPCQPGYYQAGEKYQELNYSEDCSLGKTICQMFEVTKPYEHNIRIIPDGCNDILISYDGTKISSWLSLSVSEVTRFQFQKADWLFGVRFYPGADRFLFHGNLPTNRQNPIQIKDILTDFDETEEMLRNSLSFARRHEIMEEYIEGKRTKNNSIDNILFFCVRRLIETNGTIPVEKLSRGAGYGTRYILQLFTDNIGHSTKELGGIIRVQKALQCLLEKPDRKLSDIAVNYGFSDLSHMNREFKRHMGLTSGIIRERDRWNGILKNELNRIF